MPTDTPEKQGQTDMKNEGRTMNIGVIGTGQIGGTLARQWIEKGHRVRVANSRGTEAVQSFADAIGAHATDIYGAVEDVDVIVLAIPFIAVRALPRALFDRVAPDVVIVDPSNYYPGIQDEPIEAVDAGVAETEWMSEYLGRPLIKAYNSILAYTLAEMGQPEGSPGRLAIPVAGDDPRSIEIVKRLVNDSGFDPVDGGSLAQSWRQQPSTPTYCCDYDAEQTMAALAAAVEGEAASIRDNLSLAVFERIPADATQAEAHDFIVKANREFSPL